VRLARFTHSYNAEVYVNPDLVTFIRHPRTMGQQSTSATSIPSPLKCRLEQLHRFCSPQENLELLPGHLRECQGVRLSGGLGDCSHSMRGPLESQYVGVEIGLLPGGAVPVLASRSRFPILILVWNGMGRCNPANCNHHVSFRTWHFLCKRTRSSEGRRRVGIPERNSRLVLAMFPGSDALLSCDDSSNAGSAWLLNIAQKGSVELDARIVIGCALRLFPKLSNFGQTRKAWTS
jgi:hypothetical protein